MQFTSTPRRQVQRALARSGQYNGPLFLDIACADVGNLVMRMSGADWHGIPLPDLLGQASEPIGVTSIEYVPICVLQYMRDLGWCCPIPVTPLQCSHDYVGS